MRALQLTTLRILLVLGFTPAAWADYHIVVSEQNQTASLSQTEVLHLFMGRARSFPDGSNAVAYDLAGDSPRAGFYLSLGGMSLSQVTSYWARLMFSGRCLPPQKLASQAAMMERVRRDPTAIGWLTAAPTQSGLRTVLVLKDQP
jgi:hypothetical protein